MKTILILAVVVAVASGNTLEHVRNAYKSWSEKHQPEAKQFAREQAKSIAERLEGRSVQDILKPETLEKLRTPVSLRAKWRNSDILQINNRQDGSSVSSPFFDAALPGVADEDVAETIYNAITEEIDNIVASANVDATALLQALLLAGVDGTSLSVPEIVILVGDVLGEYAAALNPVPEYIEDPDVLETDGRPVRYHDIVQDNYAKTLQGGQVIRTYYPESREGVQNIVRKAASEGARVRASGAKHSWNHWVWGVDNQYEDVEPNPCYDKKFKGDVDYFIAMVPWEMSDPLFNIRLDIQEWRERASELTFVEGPLDFWTGDDGVEHASVRCGAAALSQFYTDWALENKWMMPAEPMAPVFTLGGVVSTSSHGSGRKFPPLSNQVIELEYVDEKGDIQVVNDPEELAATAGSYGLFGILLSMTFETNRYGYSEYNFKPVVEDLETYIPRPGTDIPDYLRDIFENFYYQTWFAFVDYQIESAYPKLFQNVFKENGTEAEAQQLITPFETELGYATRNMISIVHALMKDSFEEAGSTDYLYWMYMLVERQIEVYISENAPPSEPKVATTAEAIHWIRGLHNYDVIRNFEINTPIRDDGNGNPDWSTVQEIFWIYQDVVDSYENYGIFLVDGPAELRFVAGSRSLLDSYYGNPHGTFSMDVTCTRQVPLELWNQLKNDFAFRFSRFNTGGLRKPRWHFGKEQPVGMMGMSSAEFFELTYADQIDLFNDAYKKIVESRGSKVKDSLERFSTKYFDQVLMSCDKMEKERNCKKDKKDKKKCKK